MLPHFLATPTALLSTTAWVFLMAIPLIALDNVLKRREAQKLRVDSKSLSRFG